MSEKLTIGCHLSVAKGYLAMAKDAVKIDANTFQFFTRNPRGGKAKALDLLDIAAFREFISSQGIKRILAHAPYTMNLASSKEEVRDFAFQVFTDDLVRMEHTPHQYYNFHPGAYGKLRYEQGIEHVVEILNTVLRPEQTTTVLIETMCGKGSELGGSFEELARIIAGVEFESHVGVCLDTCHVWDSGYDIVGNLESVLAHFDKVIGIQRLKAVHLNDSLNVCGARKDRHAKIGEGHIGFKALSSITKHSALRHLPFYLETPNELSGYAAEIAALRKSFV